MYNSFQSNNASTPNQSGNDEHFERTMNQALGGQTGLGDLSNVNTSNLFLNEQPLDDSRSQDMGVSSAIVEPTTSNLPQVPTAPFDLSTFLQQQVQQQNFQNIFQASLMNSNSMSTTQTNTAVLPQATSTSVTVNHDEEEEEDENGLLSKPKRSLSAYNLFFAAERKKLLKSLPPRQGKRKPRNSHGKLGFAEMARTISAKWKKITPEEKREFSELARLDGIRYRTEMAQWKQSQQEKAVAKIQKTLLFAMNGGQVPAVSTNLPPPQQEENVVQHQNNTHLSNNWDEQAAHLSASTSDLYLQTFGM